MAKFISKSYSNIELEQPNLSKTDPLWNVSTKEFPHDHINIFNKQMTDNAKKIHFSEPVYVCLPKKIIRLIRLFKVFCFKPCIGHVTCKRKREVLLHRCKQDSCLFKSSRRNKKSIGLCLRKWTGLTVTNRHVTRIAWYSCGTTTEKRPQEICRMVILLLDWLETKITFSVNFDKNLPTHLLLQISDRVA